jgi:hypothetical protein
MSPSTPRRRRAPLAVLAGLLPLALVAGLAGTAAPATAAGDDGEHPPPPIDVFASTPVDPFYGSPVTFSVRTSTEARASVFHGEDRLAGPVDIVGPTPFSIPTTGRFFAGTTYTLTVSAASDESSGFDTVTFTPRHIPSQVTVSGGTEPRVVVPFSAPVFGVLKATVDTTVQPSGGSMVIGRNGARLGTYPIRTDGTFALPTDKLLVGIHDDLQVYYDGDSAYAPTPLGSGMAVVDVEVVKMPTTTTAALSAAKVNQGDPVSILASTASSYAGTTADVKGVMEVHAARAGTDEFTKITELAYPGGKQQVSLSLQEWASTHPGFWTIRTVNHGTGIADGSASDTSLQVVAPGNPVADTSTELALSADSATVLGAPITATATVGSGDGAVGTGSVAFSVDGKVVATAPVSTAGSATATVAATVVGGQSVTAAYLGTTEYAASASTARTLTGLKAATSTTATPPTGPVQPGAAVAVRVTATGSSVVPTGAATVSEGGRVLGTVPLTAGAGSFALPTLSAGTHALTVTYPGDASTTGSTASATVTVTAVEPPPPPVVKSRSSTSLKVKKLAGRKARVTVRVRSAAVVAGIVEVRRGAKVVARGKLAADAHGTVRLVVRKLPKGASRLTVRYLGSSTVLASTSKAVKLRLR